MHIDLIKPNYCVAKKTHIGKGKNKTPILIVTPKNKPEKAPCVLWIHGGGYVIGLKELVYSSRAMDLLQNLGAVVVSPGYRLALLNPYPAAIDDCYATLLWIKENADYLGIDPDKIIVGGESAGGGLCVAVCMKARDEGKVKIKYQLPLYPMLDNYDTDTSWNNHGKIWNTTFNHFAWNLYLKNTDKDNIPIYASPARQTNFKDLPPCYTFVGKGEPFYHETLSYVENLLEAGVKADVDIYDTNVHAFDMLFPRSEVSKKAIDRFNEVTLTIFGEQE